MQFVFGGGAGGAYVRTPDSTPLSLSLSVSLSLPNVSTITVVGLEITCMYVCLLRLLFFIYLDSFVENCHVFALVHCMGRAVTNVVRTCGQIPLMLL